MDLVILAGLRASHFILISLGFALVFGSCRVLNLMHGSYVMLGAYATYGFSSALLAQGVRSSVAVPAAAVLAAASVALFGLVFFKLLHLTNRTAPRHVLAISLAGNLFVSKVVAYLYGVKGINVPPIARGAVSVGGVSMPAHDLLIAPAAALMVAALWLWLRHTRSGTALRAVADNKLAAVLLGIDADRTLARAVLVGAFMAGLAGAVRAPSETVSPHMWVHPLLISFAVVVFGGRNSLIGAVLSATFLAFAETITSWFWSEAASQYVALLAIVIGLLLFPTGLVGSPRHEDR